MLGLLQSDLSRQGVQTSSKGNCSACQKPVVGQVSHQDEAPSLWSFSWLCKFSCHQCQRLGLLLVFSAGGHSSGEGVAPGALCVHTVRGGAGEPQLLWKGRTAVLRERLLHPLLSALRPVQQAHPQRESRTCEHAARPPSTHFSCHCNLQVTYCFFRKWSQLWIKTGTRSVFAVWSAVARLERKVMSCTSCLGLTHRCLNLSDADKVWHKTHAVLSFHNKLNVAKRW